MKFFSDRPAADDFTSFQYERLDARPGEITGSHEPIVTSPNYDCVMSHCQLPIADCRLINLLICADLCLSAAQVTATEKQGYSQICISAWWVEISSVAVSLILIRENLCSSVAQKHLRLKNVTTRFLSASAVLRFFLAHP
jgi:hypothetical protein